MLRKLIFPILFLLVFTSCTPTNANEMTTDLVEPTTTIVEEETIPTEETSSSETPVTGEPSPLSGIYYEEEIVLQRPVAIMLDNHPAARWQAGLVKAEIVYEAEVEGPYTRYLAIFLCEAPEHIGPVRSARPYFIRYALEYDPIYVHVGGSMDAMKDIQDYNMADIDGLYSGEFWRYNDTGKKIPNNMYTAMTNIRNAQSYKQFRTEGQFDGFLFSEEFEKLELQSEKCLNFSIEYNDDYKIEYKFDAENNDYHRYVNGKRHVDEYYDEDLVISNIIIQKTKKQVLDDIGRLHIQNISEGTGVLIRNGEMIEITWSKTSARDKTVYKDLMGSEVVLKPGQTWIQVVTQNTVIEMEEL